MVVLFIVPALNEYGIEGDECSDPLYQAHDAEIRDTFSRLGLLPDLTKWSRL